MVGRGLEGAVAPGAEPDHAHSASDGHRRVSAVYLIDLALITRSTRERNSAFGVFLCRS
jgi:hypothetical protein